MKALNFTVTVGNSQLLIVTDFDWYTAEIYILISVFACDSCVNMNDQAEALKFYTMHHFRTASILEYCASWHHVL